MEHHRIGPQGFPGDSSGTEAACQCRRTETQVQSLGWEDSLEEEMVAYSSILAWEIPWTEELGRLPSMESQKSQTGLERTEAPWHA